MKNNKDILVSVIIPIYNCEKYINLCLRSLMKQNHSNIEIIAVDDGSTDSSAKIIDELSKQDSRIIVLHKRNKGVSAARNSGLEVASGKYVMFVDGDDYVDSNYVAYFLDLISENDSEFAAGLNHYKYAENIDPEIEDKKYIISPEKAIELIYSEKINVAVWNKIYVTKLAKEIQFNSNIWYGEGMLFNIEYLQYVDNVMIGEKRVYHQTFNPESAMRKFDINSNYCGISSMWLQKALWKRWNTDIEHQWQYHMFRFNITIISGLIRSGEKEKYISAYKEHVNDMRKNIFIPLRYEKSLKQKIAYLCFSMFPTFMGKREAKKFIRKCKANLGGVSLKNENRVNNSFDLLFRSSILGKDDLDCYSVMEGAAA